MTKKHKEPYRKCADCIHEWAGQADGVYILNKAIDLMAEYIVTLGCADFFLCDLIPKEIHLKHQPKNDGNYDHESCQKCVAEYFLKKAGEKE